MYHITTRIIIGKPFFGGHRTCILNKQELMRHVRNMDKWDKFEADTNYYKFCVTKTESGYSGFIYVVLDNVEKFSDVNLSTIYKYINEMV